MTSSSNGKATTEVAVIGLGYWGPNRLRVLQDLEEVRVRWICDLDEGCLRRFARRYPSARPSRNFDDVIADPRVDAVVIATPVFTHAALASKALNAGKHVFVEKPLATSSGDANDMVRLADRHDRVLMCGHTFVYSPPVRLIKRLLAEGQLGDLHYISSSRVNLGPYRSDVSVVFDLGSHDFSILLYWLDTLPDTISGIGRDVISPGVSDFAFVNASFPGGLVANVELSWLAPSKLRRTVLVGSEKMLVYEDGSGEPIRLYDNGIEYQDPGTFGEYHLSYRTGDIISPRVETAEPIALEMQDFVSAVRGECEPASPPEFAVDVLRMVEAAEASLNDGGEAVAISSVPGGVGARWK